MDQLALRTVVADQLEVNVEQVEVVTVHTHANASDFSFLHDVSQQQFDQIIIFNGSGPNLFDEAVRSAALQQLTNKVRVVAAHTIIGYFELGDLMRRIKKLYDYDGALTQEARSKLQLYVALHGYNDLTVDLEESLERSHLLISPFNGGLLDDIKAIKKTNEIKVFA